VKIKVGNPDKHFATMKGRQLLSDERSVDEFFLFDDDQI